MHAGLQNLAEKVQFFHTLPMLIHFKRPGREYYYIGHEGWSNAAMFSSEEEAINFRDNISNGKGLIKKGYESPFDKSIDIPLISDKVITSNTRFSLINKYVNGSGLCFFQNLTLEQLQVIYIENFANPFLIAS